MAGVSGQPGVEDALHARVAVEEIFEVKVLSVTTLNVMGKPKRLGRYAGHRSNWKKAVVRIAEGQKIEIYDAV